MWKAKNFKELILLKTKSLRDFSVLNILLLRTIKNLEACSIHCSQILMNCA